MMRKRDSESSPHWQQRPAPFSAMKDHIVTYQCRRWGMDSPKPAKPGSGEESMQDMSERMKTQFRR
ncbi:hypothetical protein EXIGLDRAFT_737008 [Exidia glandulosa HHB12029]|uniref:Uncharacterized protein n=1 Tax=Exidia glandulosa HHB12029 TaxID=1314781 RepID=A0A166N2D1_EXIGL|nr:hypothetical protein EXIGLDRAFT_737008 [Exidia glandulosa HHB12029]